MTRNNNNSNDNHINLLPLLLWLVVLCLKNVHASGAVGLGQKFAIRGPVFTHNSLDFTMDFLVSDFMDDTMVGYTLYDGLHCKDGRDQNGKKANDITANSGYLVSKLHFSDSTTPFVRGDGSGERKVKVTANVDPNQLVESPIYHQDEEYGNENNHRRSATIDFCIRFGVYNKNKEEENAMQANFLENPVTLTINFHEDITMDMEITKSNLFQAES
mmetsp:Transcript_2782/g.3091  ORF Transcript_2782/g.3091 Transcript_2782/m.3091 type:complete len:216 (-) Transcript_2782:197-844(-)